MATLTCYLLLMLVSFAAAQTPQEHDLRLQSGMTNMEGRLEIFFEGEWGTVCSDSFKIEEASVVCRQLGFLYAAEAKSFGPGAGMVVIGDLNCNGNEANILDCYHDVLGKPSCYHSYDVGVVCTDVLNTETPVTDVEAILKNGKFRLVDGPDPYQGRVEVFLYNSRTWMPICSDGWDFTRASFVCEKLGFRPATVAGTGGYGIGSGQIANCSDAAFDYYGDFDYQKDNCQIVNESDATGACSHDMAVDVICNGREPGKEKYLRFANGSQESEGRVEIYNNNVWRGLCLDDWTMAEATVACRQQGLPPPTEVIAGGTFGSSRAGDILQTSFACTGEEYSLVSCPQMPRQTPCAQGDAAVRCGEPVGEAQEFDLRLANGETLMEGRVEMLYQGEWRTICHRSFDSPYKATVACRQVGFQYGAVSTKSFGPQSGNTVLSRVICNGNEERLIDCYRDALGTPGCDYGGDFGVICSNVGPLTPTESTPADGATRLGGGPNPYEGHVEVFLGEEGVWATQCSDVWDLERANSVCRWLDYRPPTLFGRGRYSGATSSIATCDLEPYFNPYLCSLTTSCSHDEDIYVVCDAKERGEEGDVRIVNGSEPTEGRVEFYHRNAWKTLCGDDLTLVGQQIVCRMLSLPYLSVQTPPGIFGESPTYEMFEDVINCTSTETLIIKYCKRTPRQTPCVSGAAAVQCGIWSNATEGDVRLSGGGAPTRGRVEIYNSGQWGTVCNDDWDANDANAVCHHLGYRNQQYFYGSHASRAGDKPAWLNDLKCSGNEERISECGGILGEPVTCSETTLAEVRCENFPFTNYYEARLAAGPYPNQGRLELWYDGAWGTVCEDGWDIKDAEVVCRQLGFSRPVVALNAYETKSLYGSGEGAILLYELGCNGTEESIIQCPHAYPMTTIGYPSVIRNRCQHRQDVGVVCYSEDYPSDDPRPDEEDPGLPGYQVRNIVLGCLLGASAFFTILGGICKACSKSTPEAADPLTYPELESRNGGVALTGVNQNEDGPPTYESATKDTGKSDPSGETDLSAPPPSAPPPGYENVEVGGGGDAVNV